MSIIFCDRLFSRQRCNQSFILCLVLLLCGLLLIAGYTVICSTTGQDFAQDWVAVRSMLRGGSLYGHDYNLAFELLQGRTGIQNVHPPFSVWLYIPFSFLDLRSGAIVFNIFSFSILISGIYLIRKFFILDREEHIKVLIFILICYPTLSSFALMQSSVILGFLIVTGTFFFANGRDSLAAAAWAAAATLKIFPGLLFVILIMKGRFKACLTGAAIFILLCLPFLLLGQIGDLKIYIDTVAPGTLKTFMHFYANQSLSGVFSLFFASNSYTQGPFEMSAAQVIVQIAFQGFIIIASFCKTMIMLQQDKKMEACSLVMLSIILCFPIIWQHYFLSLFLLIAVLVLILNSQQKKDPILVVALIFLLLPDLDIARGLIAIFGEDLSPLASLLYKNYFFCALLLWICMMSPSYQRLIHDNMTGRLISK